MSKQPEFVLEQQLIELLQTLKYEYIAVRKEADMLVNLQKQLEKHNQTQFSAAEFKQILNTLDKGNTFQRSKTLREKQVLQRDNGDNFYYTFLNTHAWCKNEFQVANQISQEGTYKNRYDVTLLINGLPLVQIELKRIGLEMKEAFNQIKRYEKHSYDAGRGLFQYVQIFIISNGVNTKYFANQKEVSFKQTFYWTDQENKRLTNLLEEFAPTFLEPCHLSKMICKYMVLNEEHKALRVLRPYQFYAVEAIINQVKTSKHNGYIWHTTGSGKTLTSFKASQILESMPEVQKVVFVVDRKDLDFQTTKEFNHYRAGSVTSTENTKELVKQFAEPTTKLIVTTIQKLNTAISKPQYGNALEKLKNQKIIFIFDECHRSQFGETHKRICKFFHNPQMFGFTGTPIFADNARKTELGERTTADLFGNCLHRYVITDAIKDDNVLKFSVEYVGKYTYKDKRETAIDIEVEDIDTKELMESPERLNKIVDYVLAHHTRKTQNRTFTAMFCTSNVPTLIQYYELFKQKKLAKQHNLRIATIFSYTNNEDDLGAIGHIPDELAIAEEAKVLYGLPQHSRDKLESFIADYNEMFGTKFSTRDSESFYNYYNDISKKVRDRQIDILLVVNMFLTGFDSPMLNTLYVDKNLKQHGLIQAYSRTNRITDERKSQGNIVVFRNLKEETDEAIALFSNKAAVETILMKPYEDYLKKFDSVYEELQAIAPEVSSVDAFVSEDEKLAFIQAFRGLMRTKNILGSFADFTWDDLQMPEQLFEAFKSKYLDLYEEVKNNRQKEKVSVLHEVDFELELIHRDDINVNYILQLLINLKNTNPRKRAKSEQEILDLLQTEITLRSKKDLIEQFIKKNLPILPDDAHIPHEFDTYWEAEKKRALENLTETENLDPEQTLQFIEHCQYMEEKNNRWNETLKLLKGNQPSILERKNLGVQLLNKILDFIDTFINGI